MKEDVLGEILGNLIVVGIAYCLIDDVSVWEISWQVILGSVGWHMAGSLLSQHGFR